VPLRNCLHTHEGWPTLLAAEMQHRDSSFWWYQVYMVVHGGSL